MDFASMNFISRSAPFSRLAQHMISLSLVLGFCPFANAQSYPVNSAVTHSANDNASSNSATNSPDGASSRTGEAAAKPAADCREGLTDSDREGLLEIENQLKLVKDAGVDSPIFQNRLNQLMDKNFASLSPQAKAMFVQIGLKMRLQAETSSKELKRALTRYKSNCDFHIQIFGPGGPYANMGYMDTVFGKGLEILEGSMKDLSNSSNELSIELDHAYKKGLLTPEAKSKLAAAIREQSAIVTKISMDSANGTVERLVAAQKTIILTAGAAIATVATAGAAAGLFAGAMGPMATAAFIGGGSGVSGTIFAGEGKMLAEAAASGNDIGCEFAIRAVAGNDKLARDALRNGLIGAVTGAGVGKLIGLGGKVGATTVVALKGLTVAGITVGSFGTGANATKAMESYGTARELAAQSDEAYQKGDVARARELHQEASEALKKTRGYTANTAISAIGTAMAADSLRCLGKLKTQFNSADKALAASGTSSAVPPKNTLAPSPKNIDKDFAELPIGARQGIKDAHTQVPTETGTVAAGQLSKQNLRDKVKLMKNAGINKEEMASAQFARETRRRAIEGGYAGFEDANTKHLANVSLKRIMDADDPVERVTQKGLGSVKEELAAFKTNVKEELQSVRSTQETTHPGWDNWSGATTSTATAGKGVQITTDPARAKTYGLDQDYPTHVTATPVGKDEVRIDVQFKGHTETISVPAAQIPLTGVPKEAMRPVMAAVSKHYQDQQSALKALRLKNLETVQKTLDTIDPADSLGMAEKMRQIMDFLKIDY